MTTVDWEQYVSTFHTRRAGTTESLLSACVDTTGMNPYRWVAQGLGSGRVIDLGCGSSPTADMVGEAGSWIGLDRSHSELTRAVAHGRGPVIQGDAHSLPLAGTSMDVVLASMSMMVLRDPAAAMAESARVLRGGGTIRMLVPTDGPLSTRDRVRYTLLLAALGRTAMPFPHPEVVSDPVEVLRGCGFEVLADERRCFRLTFDGADDPALFMDSLYVPGVSRRRIAVASAIVGRWAGSRSDRSIGLPVRRITARVRVP